VACWSTKAAISLKRVEIEEKLLCRAYRKSQTLFRTVPPPIPTASPSPRLGVRNPTPKLQSLLSQEGLKLRTTNIWPIHSQVPSEHKPMKKFGEKGAWAYPGICFEYPLLSQEQVKVRISNFVRTFLVSIGTKPITNFGKSCRLLVRTLEVFQGTHNIYWAHRAVLFAIAELSCSQ